MASYSVAATKDNLSRLIDKALAGEEVIITRHGKPTVEMRVVETESEPAISRKEAFARLKRLRDSLPAAKLSYLELKRLDEADGLL